MNVFDGIKTSVEVVTTDVAKIAKELELEAEPGNVTDLLKSHGKT